MILNLVSIIIPVYNTEQFLQKCLQSVVNQTYKNIEIIIINDGSSDNSHLIIEEFSVTDNRIKVVNQTNKGISGARNRAVKEASGDYIMFVDSDDWINENMIEILVKTMLRGQTNMVVSNYYSEFRENAVEKRIILKERIITDKERNTFISRLIGPKDNELKNPHFVDGFSTVWGKIYKKDIIQTNQISFIDLSIIGSNEDLLFNLEYLKHCNEIILLPDSLYHYRKNDMSYTTKYRENLYLKWNNLFEQISKITGLYQNSTFLNNRIALSIIGLGINEFHNPKGKVDIIKFYQKLFKTEPYQTSLSQLSIRYMPIHWKVFFWTAKKKQAKLFYYLIWIIEKYFRK